jgi:hypothetical protein
MMENSLSPAEEILLKSLDGPVSASERDLLAEGIQTDITLRRHSDHYRKIREMLHRPTPDSFGPFFPERIINAIQNRKKEVEYLILFFFKKYQVLVMGVIVALVIANLLLSGEISVAALFGLEKESTEDIFSIDVYENLTE